MMNTTGQTARDGQILSIRLWMDCLATQELLCMYLGIRLGLYDALAKGGPATPVQLADRAGIASRYAREWLEQQAVAGLLGVDDIKNCARGPSLHPFAGPPRSPNDVG